MYKEELKMKWNPQQNEFNNIDLAIEEKPVDLPRNIIPPERNAIEQQNGINKNEFLKIKETLTNA